MLLVCVCVWKQELEEIAQELTPLLQDLYSQLERCAYMCIHMRKYTRMSIFMWIRSYMYIYAYVYLHALDCSKPCSRNWKSL